MKHESLKRSSSSVIRHQSSVITPCSMLATGTPEALHFIKGKLEDYYVFCGDELFGFSSEDEVEIPDFQDQSSLECACNFGGKSISLKRVGSTSEVDEQISDDEGSKMLFNSVAAVATVSETLDLYTRRKGKRLQPGSEFAGDRDSRRQVQLDENASCSALHPFYIEDKSLAIGGRQPQTRPASHFRSHKQGVLCHSVHEGKSPESTTDEELLDEPETFNYLFMDKTTFEPLGGSDGEKMSDTIHASPVEAAFKPDHCKYSMVELLDDLHRKKRNLHLKLGRRKERTGQSGVIKSVSSLLRAVTSEEDPCEIRYSESSMDEEEEAHSLKNAVVESGRKTMVDKFHEAFDSASVDNRRPPITVPKHSSTGLFGRLQHVMQRQKGQDTEFLKKVQAEVWPRDEASCIDVQILSRSFDAKLTVCRCSLLENEESSLENPQQENVGKTWTIIFNSRVCGDIELEVANLIRVHPPWKEVQVLQGGEIIILASYFSQIYT